MLVRSAMVLSSVRAAQYKEAGSSSFPGVGASVPPRIRRPVALSLRLDRAPTSGSTMVLLVVVRLLVLDGLDLSRRCLCAGPVRGDRDRTNLREPASGDLVHSELAECGHADWFAGFVEVPVKLVGHGSLERWLSK
jgi:hypothetical protein